MRYLVVIAAVTLLRVFNAQAMEFSVQYNGGNCEACGWVLAQGVIDQGTTEKLKAFVAKEKPPSNIRFDSPGGNIVEALKLGQFLRESSWDTFVGEETVLIPGSHLTAYRTQPSSCYSACVYAFAGGVHRTAADKSVGIHQFYRPNEAARPNDKTLTAIDMANMQRLAALPKLVTIASAITPWEPVHLLSSAELKSLNLDNSSAPSSGTPAVWSVQPAGDGAMAITTQTQDGTGRTASLGIMCLQSMPNMIIARLAVKDDTKDWAQVFSSLDLSPQDFTFQIDGKYKSLDAKRLVSPVKRSGNGAMLTLAVLKDELGSMMKAKSVELSGL
jgi:hypothetical protein